MITHEQLVEMFDNMARETSWDLRKPLVWGYFFTHGSRPALEAVVPLLQERGSYRTEYPGSTLRENLGLPAIVEKLVPASV